jgi:hypothetical protein
VTRELSISITSKPGNQGPFKLSDFKPCACFGVLRLWGGVPSVTWKEQERRVKADVVRVLGWVKRDATNQQALRAVRGRGGRGRLLKENVRRVVVLEDQLPGIRADVAACLRWVRHLKRSGVRGPRDLTRHLIAEGVTVHPPDALDDALGSIGPGFLTSPTARLTQKLGRGILAELWGLGDEEAVKAKMLPRRRFRTVRGVQRDLGALLNAAEHSTGSRAKTKSRGLQAPRGRGHE